jgi:hypothetical protein
LSSWWRREGQCAAPFDRYFNKRNETIQLNFCKKIMDTRILIPDCENRKLNKTVDGKQTRQGWRESSAVDSIAELLYQLGRTMGAVGCRCRLSAAGRTYSVTKRN